MYPWPTQIYYGDLDSRHVRVWKDWCEGKCTRFLNLFPAIFYHAKKHGGGFYEKLFIAGDVHFNDEGNKIIAQALLKSNLP